MTDETPAISAEVAEEEFARFCEEMDLDVDTSEMDDDDRLSLRDAKKVFLRAVMRNKLTVDGDGVPTFHYQRGNGEGILEIRFPEPTGKAFLAMDKAKKNATHQKSFLMLEEVTKTPAAVFANMGASDLKVCQMVLALFLG